MDKNIAATMAWVIVGALQHAPLSVEIHEGTPAPLVVVMCGSWTSIEGTRLEPLLLHVHGLRYTSPELSTSVTGELRGANREAMNEEQSSSAG
eukprot:1160238-Pelagomonas_calceolata.AAC.4